VITRYAGFDPDENNFDGVELAPLHEEELRAPRRTRIDTKRAWKLKHEGFSWAEIGKILACEQGRAANYQPLSVYIAANYRHQ
jgi:hypothetical protein